MRIVLFLYPEQRGADFLIAVKHSRCMGSQLIADLLTYGPQTPFQASKRGLDLT